MPRRPKYPCGICSYACKSGVLACDDCGQWIHKECIGMSTSLFTRLGDCSDRWHCPSCKSINNSNIIYKLSFQNNSSVNDVASRSPSASDTIPSQPVTPNNSSAALSYSLESETTRTSLSHDNYKDETVLSLDEANEPLLTSSPKRTHLKKDLQRKNQLRILNINFQSARKKAKLLEAIIDDTDPDIIIGTETWLDSSISSSELLPPYLGFDIHRRDRVTDAHGGVLLAAKKDLQLGEVELGKDVEIISGSIQLKSKKLFLASYYRPPNRMDEYYNREAASELCKIKEKAKNNIMIVGGDFNLPDIDWNTLKIVGRQYPERVNRTYLDAIADIGSEQVVKFPTRKDNVLDLIITTHPSLCQRCKPLPSIGNSDHDIVLFDCAISPFRPHPKRRKIILWKKADTKGIKQDYLDFVSEFMATPDNVQVLWTLLKTKTLEIIQNRVPTKMSSSRFSNPWMNTDIRRATRRKQRAHTKSRKTKKKRDIKRYERLQKEVKSMINEAHKQYLVNTVSEDFNTKSKKFWSYVKSKRQDSTGVSPLKNAEGFLQSDSVTKAEILNQQFQSAFTAEDTSNIPSKGDSPFPDMEAIQVNTEGVRKLLLNLKVDKATGPDSIPAFILKTASDELAPMLTRLFQLSLETGEVPHDWRQAWVVPIFKKGERHIAANYRPVSLTSITCKILEHIVHSSIMKHFDQHAILTDSQHGFRRNRSCVTQLVVTVHEIAQQLAKDSQVDVILLDFSKAFDKVPHARLLTKLDHYGVRNKTLNWISAFLSQRQQQVLLEGVMSSPVAVQSGVPQGTVLGPLLFLAFINDLPECIQFSSTKLFADDSLLFKAISSSEDSMQLQKDLSSLEQWETTWQMSFNPSKCNVIRITPNKKKAILQTSYKLHGQTLETKSSSSYLGVSVTDDLSWGDHIEKTVNKSNRTLGFLRRNFRDCTHTVKEATYKTMVRPIIEYASPVWDPTSQKYTSEIEKVQRRAARYVFNSYTDRSPGCVTNMLTTLQWEPLAERRLNDRLTLLYKINNNIVNINKSQFYTASDSRTRGTQRLFQERTSHPVLYNSYFPRTMRQWNKLNSKTTAAPSLESFQAGLRHDRGLALMTQ